MRLRSIAPPAAKHRAQERRAGRARALGVELRAGRRGPRRRGSRSAPPSTGVEASTQRGGGVLHGVGVREVARRRKGGRRAGAPSAGSTSFQPMCGRRRAPHEPRGGAGQQAEAGGVALLAAREQQLHADAHAEAGARRRARAPRIASSRPRSRSAVHRRRRPARRPGSRRTRRSATSLGPVGRPRPRRRRARTRRAASAGCRRRSRRAWRSQNALRAGDAAAGGVGLDRLAQRQRHRLEGRLGDVVGVLAASR